MKFEFCGELDCPDWILAQLYRLSLSIDSHRFKIICEGAKDIILADGNLNDEELMDPLNLDSEFDIDDARAGFGVVHFILTCACLEKVSTHSLRSELEQAGLPSEHCRVLCQVMDENVDQMIEHMD